MTTKLIAENILEAADFLSATEQEGEHVGQPVPDSGNSGDFRLLSKGAIADFAYSGTATGDGSTTTMVDSVLSAFGDDYFIGGTITFTGGENTSGSKTITDFAQATGTLTWSGALNSTLTADTFTLTLAFASRDFRVELIGSGDAGAATFKWSHDGGTTYFGRDDPDQATWLAQSEIDTDAKNNRPILMQAANGDLVAVFQCNTDLDVQCRISSDHGITWSARIEITAETDPPHNSLVLSSGRILVYTDSSNLYKSDDHGQTWSALGSGVTTNNGNIIELKNGNLLRATQSGTNQCVYISIDKGNTWGDAITVSAEANNQFGGGLVEMDNGDILCVYNTDEDSAGDYEIKGRISTDGGATWGSNIDILDFGNDLTYPTVVKDIDGKIFMACVEELADKDIVYCTSSDNGATWGAKTALATAAGGDDCLYPQLALINGHELACIFVENTSNDLQMVRRGMWEAYSANACPCAPDAATQELACGAGIVWHGGAGDVGDIWQFEAAYDYAMANLIEDSPRQCWRSTQDNIECSIVIDMGANERHFADGVALFGCNVRTLDFQMNATDSWGGPSVDEAVSFDLATGTVDAAAGNYLQDTSLLAGYKDHELAGNYLRMTSGADDTVTWEIKDNVGDYIVLDTAAANSVAATDTFVIFQPHIAVTFTAGVYRFLRISIGAQHTAGDYYQLGTLVAGRAVTLTRDWGVGYGRTHKYDIAMLRPAGGGMIPVKNAGRRRLFDLIWKASEDTRQEVLALVDHIEGQNIALIPDSGTLTDCYLVKALGDIRQQHRFRSGNFDFGLQLEEVL